LQSEILNSQLRAILSIIVVNYGCRLLGTNLTPIQNTVDNILDEKSQAYARSRPAVQGLFEGAPEAIGNNMFWNAICAPSNGLIFPSISRQWARTVYKHLIKASAALQTGRWLQWELRSTSFDLQGKGLGLVGMGRIGRAVVHLRFGGTGDDAFSQCNETFVLMRVEKLRCPVRGAGFGVRRRESGRICQMFVRRVSEGMARHNQRSARPGDQPLHRLPAANSAA
jgi:hypothetical protein